MLSNLDLIKCNHNFYHYQNTELRYLYQTMTGLFFGHVLQNSSLTDRLSVTASIYGQCPSPQVLEINESWNSLLCLISFLSKFDEPVNFIILSDFSEFIIDIETSIFFLWKGKCLRMNRNIRCFKNWLEEILKEMISIWDSQISFDTNTRL